MHILLMSASSDKTHRNFQEFPRMLNKLSFILFYLTNKKKGDLKQKNWILYLRDFDVYSCNRMLSSVSCCLRIREWGPKMNRESWYLLLHFKAVNIKRFRKVPSDLNTGSQKYCFAVIYPLTTAFAVIYLLISSSQSSKGGGNSRIYIQW